MHRIIKLDLPDIITRPCGNNLAIVPPHAADNLWIILSPEAARELADDIGTILPMIQPEGEQKESNP